MVSHIKRNSIKTLLAIAISGALGYKSSGAEETQKANTKNKNKIKLRMVTSFPKNLPGADIPAQRLAYKINSMSDGLIEVKHYGAGELVPAFEVFDAVSNGVVDCGVSAPYYWMSKNSAMPFFCSIPGGMTSNEIFVWLNQSNGQELWDRLYAKYNLKGFSIGNTGTTMGGWFKKPVTAISDFRGLKMRIPGLGGEVLNRLGGIAVNIPGGEVVNSLKLGVIDAAEWAGPWPDTIMGFHKVAKYYYGPGIHEPSTLIEFMINKKIWESFDNSTRDIITNACHANYIEGIAESFFNNAKTLDVIRNKKNVEVGSYSKEITNEMFNIANKILDDKAKNNKEYSDILSSYRKNIKLFNKFHLYSDQEFLNLRIKNS